MIPILVALFVLSGIAGLIYESIWSRYLGLFVGHSAYAQIVVLVIFMGGMAVGALAVGRRVERIREPLRGYAIVEALIGLAGLLFHPLFEAATTTALDVWFPSLAGTVWLPLVKWGLAGLLILPQSILLGTTFPLMSAGVIRRRPGHPGQPLGTLYFANSLGASAGVLLSGFVLVGAIGLPGTVMTAGSINILVAAAVLLLLRRERRTAGSPPAVTASVGGAPEAERPRRTGPPARSGRPEPQPPELPSLDPTARALLVTVSFGTALASFLYEIGWIRMLSLVLSSATHAFEVMLSAFILGLALGAVWIGRRADRIAHPLRFLGILQWIMGTLAILSLPVYLLSFQWMSALVPAVREAPAGYELFTVARYGICLAIMLPTTFCAGATLPLLTRTLMAAGTGERAIGLVYGVNTLGSIVGAAIAGLVLMPMIGLKGLLVAGALLDAGLGVLLLRHRIAASARLAWVAAGSTALAAAAALAFVPFDHATMTGGVYRYGQLLDPATAEIPFYRDGRTATVSVHRSVETGRLLLTTNGKPDASLEPGWLRPPGERPRTLLKADESVQILLALVSLAHARDARTAAVIGQGSGMTSHFLLGSPRLQSVETIEIEPEVLNASRQFLPANRRVFEDPRSHFVVDDAKSHFAARRRRYDLIVSEPSNPWVSGVSGLFSTEFYHRVTRHLSPDGVLGQWLHLYELDDDLVLTVLAAIQRNFNAYEIFFVDAGDVLIVATNRPSGLTPDWSVVRDPAIAADLEHVPPFSPGIFEALRVVNRPVMTALLEREAIRPNSDYFPLLDLGAERTRLRQDVAGGLMDLYGDRFALPPIVLRRALSASPTPFVPAPEILRLRSLSIGAALRAPGMPPVNPRLLDPRLVQGLERRARLEAQLASAVPPADWRAWTLDVLRAEEDLHLGTTGFADEAFYAPLADYMRRAGAPVAAWRAVGFVHDVARWNFAAAAPAVDSLIALAQAGQEWVPSPLLLDGAVATGIQTGDVRAARRAYEALLSLSSRGRGDLRSRLTEAYLYPVPRR